MPQPKTPPPEPAEDIPAEIEDVGPPISYDNDDDTPDE
jgi:hypothetical protein